MKKAKKILFAFSFFACILLIVITIIYTNQGDNQGDYPIAILYDSLSESDILVHNLGVIYSAPHLPYVRAFNYSEFDNAFTEQEDEYIYGVYGYINRKRMESIFSHEIKALEAEFGQVALAFEDEAFVMLAFDGWRFIEQNAEEKKYTILIEKNGYVSEKTIHTHVDFYAYNIIGYGNEYFILGYRQEVINNNRDFTNSLMIYNIESGVETIIFTTGGLFNMDGVIIVEDNLIFICSNSHNLEYLLAYSLETNEILEIKQLSNYKKNNSRHLQHMIYIDEMIIIIYTIDDNYLGLIKLNSTFDVLESLFFNIDFYELLVSVEVADNIIFVLTGTREYGILGALDINNLSQYETLIIFQLIDDDIIFLSDLYFVDKS